MTHIKRLNEMVQSSHRMNESIGDDSYFDFFGKMMGLYDLYKFDKLCPDLDYGNDEFESTLMGFGIKTDTIHQIARAYYESIFDTYKNDLIEKGVVTEDEAEDIEMDFNPIEFHIDDEYFETTDELINIINNRRGGRASR